MSRIALDISGMTCAACSARVAKALSRVDGVADAEVNLALERANIELTGEGHRRETDRSGRKRRATAPTLRSNDEARQRAADAEREAARLAEERRTLTRFAVSALLVGLCSSIGTLPMMLGTGHEWIGPWTQAALAAGVDGGLGTRFYREAFNAVRGGGANMAVLVSLGTSVAFFASLFEVIRGNTHADLYFEAAAVVLTLVMLGKYLEARAKRGAGAALAALGRLQPAEAELVTPGGTRDRSGAQSEGRRHRAGEAGRALPERRHRRQRPLLGRRGARHRRKPAGRARRRRPGADRHHQRRGRARGRGHQRRRAIRGLPAWRGWSRRHRPARRRSRSWSTASPRSSCRSSS